MRLTVRGKDWKKVVLNDKDQRFELTLPESKDKAFIEFEWSQDKKALDLVHTFVPESLRGKGIAAVLAKAAFEYAKTKQLKVIPSCSYLSETFVPKNAEYAGLVFKP